MNRFLLILAFLLASNFAFSQMNGDADYSFGVRAYNYMGLPKTLNQSDNHRYINTEFSSYMIKFNDNLFSYRLIGSYLNKSTSFANNSDSESANGKVKDYFFKAGFEKNFNYGHIQPYIGFDLGYRSDEFNGTLTGAAIQNTDVFTRKRGFTISPVLGIKFNPIKAVSFFAEANAEWFYAWGKTSSTLQAEEASNTVNKFKKGEILYNPVSAGIQFHLGHRN